MNIQYFFEIIFLYEKYMPQDENVSEEIFHAMWSAFFEHKETDSFWLTQEIKIVSKHEMHHLKALDICNSKQIFFQKFHVSILYNIKFNIEFNTFLIFAKTPSCYQNFFWKSLFIVQSSGYHLQKTELKNILYSSRYS